LAKKHCKVNDAFLQQLFRAQHCRGRWKWRTWKWRTVEMSRHEIDGHENAGHASGVWIGLHGIGEWIQKRVDTWYSCVLVLGYAFQLFYNYRRSIQLTSLLWLVFCRCFEKNCTLHCNVIYFQTIYILSSNFMSVIFSQPTLSTKIKQLSVHRTKHSSLPPKLDDWIKWWLTDYVSEQFCDSC